MFLSRLSLLILTLCPLPSHHPALTSAHVLPTRTQHCSNAPAIVAGTKLTRHIPPPPLHPRTNSYIWCVHGTETYITTRMLARVTALPLATLMDNAYAAVFAHLTSVGDGLLPGGEFGMEYSGLQLTVTNANNRQMTWGVLASALWGLRELMQQEEMYACMHMWVYDGIHQVGMGGIAWRG